MMMMMMTVTMMMLSLSSRVAQARITALPS